jgi:hypothetical protein
MFTFSKESAFEKGQTAEIFVLKKDCLRRHFVQPAGFKIGAGPGAVLLLSYLSNQ